MGGKVPENSIIILLYYYYIIISTCLTRTIHCNTYTLYYYYYYNIKYRPSNGSVFLIDYYCRLFFKIFFFLSFNGFTTTKRYDLNTIWTDYYIAIIVARRFALLLSFDISMCIIRACSNITILPAKLARPRLGVILVFFYFRLYYAIFGVRKKMLNKKHIRRMYSECN